jgi:hypothetical protein
MLVGEDVGTEVGIAYRNVPLKAYKFPSLDVKYIILSFKEMLGDAVK